MNIKIVRNRPPMGDRPPIFISSVSIDDTNVITFEPPMVVYPGDDLVVSGIDGERWHRITGDMNCPGTVEL